MSAQDLHIEKINLINWITRLQDASIIEKLKKIQSIQDSDKSEIPEWHKEIVLSRIENTPEENYIQLDDLDGRMDLGSVA